MIANAAAQIGPTMFSWWPDWRGQCAAIVASGPSAKRMRPELLRDRCHVIAIKESVELCPWAEVVYGCDGHWWEHRKGLKESSAVKITYDAGMASRYRLQKVSIDLKRDDILTEQPMLVGNGKNSGFQALNLAVQFGATDVLLLGFDMNDPGNPHWYGRNKWNNCSNPMGTNFAAWMAAFRYCAPSLKRLGVNVVVVSDVSRLDCFARTANLAQQMEEWGL